MADEPVPGVVVELDRLRRARAAQRELPRSLSMTATTPEWLVKTWVEVDADGCPAVVALVTRSSWSACFPVNIVVEGERIRVVVRALGP